jgi:diguanylate cyclase (GGDEF)-like protein
MIKKKKIDESLSLSGGIRNIILCFMCFRNHGQQFSEGEMRMKKGMLKGQRRKLLFTVIFIMILTVSLNMIAFIWFQLRVYHMTFQQEFVYVKEIQELSVRFFVTIVTGLILLAGMICSELYQVYKMTEEKHRRLEALNGVFQLTLQKTKDIPFEVDMKQKRILLYGDMENECEKHYSLDRIHPSEMVKAGYICEEGLTQYEKLYFSIMEEKECEPVVLPVQYGGKRGWIRSRTIINGKEKNKKIIGVLENYDEQKEKEAEIEHHLKNINKIQKASQRDFLTGVYNREGLIQNIEKALKEDKNKQGVDAFFILDLDHFKEINDFLGHGTGDQVLQNTAKILDQCFRKEDIVGRLGGDEFVLLIRRINRIEAVHRMAKRLNESLCNTYEKDGQRIQISASIGIALGQAETESFEKLYEKADEALYEVKREQKNGYKIYEGQSRV